MKLFAVALGILTAIGGFVDIGDLVTNGLVGARFGLSLVWATLLGLVGICLYAEMSGRVAAVTRRGTFDLVRERLGPRAGLANLAASFFVTLLTFGAEIGGVALSLELASSVNYLLWVPMIALLLWLVMWRVKFSWLENGSGLLGLALIVFGVALWRLHPDWGNLVHQIVSPHNPSNEKLATYFYYAIALFGAAMTPYEVFFFSSGGVEEGWSRKDLITERVNVFIGFPLGAMLSIAIAAVGALVLKPRGITVDHLSQVGLPVAFTLGKIGLAIAIIGFIAATFGAALETGLSCGYTAAQYFGWQWGKYVRPRKAARFHLVVLLSLIIATGLVLTTIDPVKLTEFSVVFSAIALPLTYFPILVIANDPEYMGEQVNSRWTNVLASVMLVVILVASVAALPLMLWTKAGQ
ncbi:MAG TPA: divalent metal cation transporter [Jatrophihabitantaceae bacterium]|nr:divalent metal cation transporter [Jatrophihabitantaceae bacterium]